MPPEHAGSPEPPPTPPAPPSDPDYVEWLGRIGIALGSVPDLRTDADGFAEWRAETRALLDRPPSDGASEPQGSWWDMLTQIWRQVARIPTLLEKVGSLVAALTFGKGIGSDLRGLCGQVGQALTSVLEGFVKDVGKVWSTIASKVALVARARGGASLKALEGEFEKLEASVRMAVRKEVETALRPEADAAATSLRPLIDHLRAVRAVAVRDAMTWADRFEGASNSLLVLLEAVSPAGGAFGDVATLFKELLFPDDGDDPDKQLGKALEDLVVQLVVAGNPVLRVLGRLLLPANDPDGGLANRLFPFPIAPGMLSDWLNGVGPFPTKQKVPAEELAFRRELVAALDRYLRSESPDLGAVVRASDQRASVEVLSDLVHLLVSVTFGFVFRSDGLPSPTLPRLDFANAFASRARADDLAGDFAANLSRQVTYPLKSLLGVVLNGVWAVSPNNPALVEAVSSSLATLIRGAIEYAANDLLTACEIHETYEGGALGAIVYQWATPRPQDDGAGGATFYAVYRRPGKVGGVVADLLSDVLNGPDDVVRPVLSGLLRDYVAYREAVRAYRPQASGGNVDDVRGAVAVEQGSVVVRATSTWTDPSLPSTPVLRAYYDGIAYLLSPEDMRPLDGGGQAYRATIPAAAGQRGVWLVSNYGGSCFVAAPAT